MWARIMSATVQGVHGVLVTVEVDFRFGLPSFSIVGLPDTGVRESRERVITAIKNSGFTLPLHRITVNLAPADLRKERSIFDFSIAMGLLTAAGHLSPSAADGYAFLGELGLNGELRPVKGVLPCAIALSKSCPKGLLLAEQNAPEAGLVNHLSVLPIRDLNQAVGFLTHSLSLSPVVVDRATLLNKSRPYPVDFSDVKGQGLAKRALEIAAAGGHNVLLLGPPGSGKTLLARRLPTIMPDMSFEEALETTAIHSVAGTLKPGECLVAARPFRHPHHQVSDAALIGGGAHPRPGEISLAHRGVLFLDEFPEFNRNVIEGLRQPMEERFVSVSRVSSCVIFPSDFLLVAAANPCPCGHFGSRTHRCSCSPQQIHKYRARISGPILDRIDLHVDVPTLKWEELQQEGEASETSATIRRRVQAARDQQARRFRSSGIMENGQMTFRHIKEYCRLTQEGTNLLHKAVHRLGFSVRAFDRIRKVSRTIADLDGCEQIETHHLSEAIGYREKNWVNDAPRNYNSTLDITPNRT